MLNMGPWDSAGWGTGIAPSRTHPATPRPHHPGYTPPVWQCALSVLTAVSGQREEVVGLISVDRLSLSLRFSGSRGITEVYNLRVAGNPNNHLSIPGTK